MEWSEDPVITTLESISAPINEIQFPTVTVCEEVPPDNWALPEKILNLLAFECKREECRSYPPSYPLFLQEKCQNPSSECTNSTEKIRKDFEFMIRTVVKEYWNILKDESIDATNSTTSSEVSQMSENFDDVLKTFHCREVKENTRINFLNRHCFLLRLHTKSTEKCAKKVGE